jgi:type II secretory pathway pseudopilin PulG
MRRDWQLEHGFTWIEILIFIALLGALAALAIPRLQMLYERSLEKATRYNIGLIKSAISIYYGDHEGIWPTTLDVNDKTPGFGFGNYLESLPPVRATHPRDPSQSPAGNEVAYQTFTDAPSLTAPNHAGRGWRYDGPRNGNTGRIWVNSTSQDTEGVPYTTYGYQ